MGLRLSQQRLRVCGGASGKEGGQQPNRPFANMPCDFISYHEHAASILETCFFKIQQFQKPLLVLGNVVLGHILRCLAEWFSPISLYKLSCFCSFFI